MNELWFIHLSSDVFYSFLVLLKVHLSPAVDKRILNPTFHFIEPFVASAPQISVISKIITFEAELTSPFSLTCPAQGAPTPSFR